MVLPLAGALMLIGWRDCTDSATDSWMLAGITTAQTQRPVSTRETRVAATLDGLKAHMKARNRFTCEKCIRKYSEDRNSQRIPSVILTHRVMLDSGFSDWLDSDSFGIVSDSTLDSLILGADLTPNSTHFRKSDSSPIWLMTHESRTTLVTPHQLLWRSSLLYKVDIKKHVRYRNLVLFPWFPFVLFPWLRLLLGIHACWRLQNKYKYKPDKSVFTMHVRRPGLAARPTFDDAVVLQRVHVAVALVFRDLAASEFVEDFAVGGSAGENLPSSPCRLVLVRRRLARQHLEPRGWAWAELDTRLVRSVRRPAPRSDCYDPVCDVVSINHCPVLRCRHMPVTPRTRRPFSYIADAALKIKISLVFMW